MTSHNDKDAVVKSAAVHDSIDPEFDYYLFEVHLNDRVEHEMQRMMEYRQWEELLHQKSFIPKNQ